MQNRSQISTNPESASRIEPTFPAKPGSSLGVVQDGEAMLEDLLGSAGLQLADEAKVLPLPAAAIVDLALKAVQLRVLRRPHHRPRTRREQRKIEGSSETEEEGDDGQRERRHPLDVKAGGRRKRFCFFGSWLDHKF